MNYINILSRAWKITWNHKILWLFGVLAGIGSGGGGGNGGGGRGGGQGAGDGFPGAAQLQRWLERPEIVTVIIVVAVILIVIGLALFVLSIIGRGGLIGGIRLADDKGTVTFGEAWGIGTRSFWRLLLLGLLVVLPVLLIIVFTVFVGALTAGLGLLCLLPLICLLLIALIPLAIVAHFAQFGVVIDDLGVMDAFRKGWEVLKANLGPVIVLGLILLVVGFIAGLILAAPLLVIVIPAVFAAALGGREFGLPFLAVAGAAVLCYLPIAVVLSGILQTWTMSAWTLAYRQFTGKVPALAPPAASGISP